MEICLNVCGLPVFNCLCALPVEFCMLFSELMHALLSLIAHLLSTQLHLLVHLCNLLCVLQLHLSHYFALGHFLLS